MVDHFKARANHFKGKANRYPRVRCWRWRPCLWQPWRRRSAWWRGCHL